jgi:hypothetical protein
MMKMIPDAEGTTVTLTDGEFSSVSGSVDMSSTFVEDMDDLGVAVFVQEASSKMIFQSAYSVESMVGLNEGDHKSDIVLYPIPSNGRVYFSKPINDADIYVFNAYGQMITDIQDFNGNVVDFTSLPSGNYILRIEGNGLHAVKPVSIIK